MPSEDQGVKVHALLQLALLCLALVGCGHALHAEGVQHTAQAVQTQAVQLTR